MVCDMVSVNDRTVCRARLDCKYVQSDRALHFLQLGLCSRRINTYTRMAKEEIACHKQYFLSSRFLAPRPCG